VRRVEKVVPKVLDGGVCRVCGKPRVINMQRGVPVGAYLSDEFCSSKCAKEFYGTEEPR
jgi:hypothetical protein